MTTRDTLPDPHPGLSPRLNAQVAQSLMNMEFHVEGETRAYTTTTIEEVEEAAADPDATSAGR